jgi:hypothetical protein
MNRLLRGVTRVFALVVAVTTLFGMGSAAVAAVTKRRIATTKDPASNEPTATSVFAGERFESRAPALRRGRVITWFAGHDVDLRGATLDPSGATLDLRTMYGGTQVAIPDGWRVESHVRSIFGGTQVDVHDADLPADAPVLQLRGFSLFGSVRVTSSPDTSWSGEDHDGEALPPATSVTTTPAVEPGTAALDGSGPAADGADAFAADETVVA